MLWEGGKMVSVYDGDAGFVYLNKALAMCKPFF